MVQEIEKSPFITYQIRQLQDIKDHDGRYELKFRDGSKKETDWLIAADGRSSITRTILGVHVEKYTYSQHALVFTAHLHDGHDNVAHEHFLEQGPLAVLPLPENRANIVWTLNEQYACDLQKLGPYIVQDALNDVLGNTFGLCTVETEIWRYPLGLHWAQKFGTGKTFFIGDVAHGIHPIAGQGLNLGLRDVATLTEIFRTRLFTAWPAHEDMQREYERCAGKIVWRLLL